MEIESGNRVEAVVRHALVCLAICASGCASVAPTESKPTATPPGGTASAIESAKGECKSDNCWFKITPLSSLWTGFQRPPNQNYADAYTRLIITSRHTRAIAGQSQTTGASLPPTESFATYPYNDRGWFSRLFWGTHYSITFTAQMTVGTGDTRFDATVPLLSISHTSNRTAGERFDRLVNHSLANFPLFLVKGDGSNSIARLKFLAKASDEYDGGAGAAAIRAAQGVISIVAPESAVLTKLTAQKSRDASQAIDQAIAEIYAKSITEQQVVENDVRRWDQGAQLTVKIPNWQDESNWSDDGRFHGVGSWT
ncbi:MAG: hypothetical protein ACRET8_10620, partial [Burkholderiales bacterium]